MHPLQHIWPVEYLPAVLPTGTLARDWRFLIVCWVRVYSGMTQNFLSKYNPVNCSSQYEVEPDYGDKVGTLLHVGWSEGGRWDRCMQRSRMPVEHSVPQAL